MIIINIIFYSIISISAYMGSKTHTPKTAKQQFSAFLAVYNYRTIENKNEIKAGVSLFNILENRTTKYQFGLFLDYKIIKYQILEIVRFLNQQILTPNFKRP